MAHAACILLATSAAATSDVDTSPARLVAGLVACAALNGSVSVHMRHFLQQQQQQRRFLRRLPNVCAQSAENFLPHTHALLKPMQAAIVRHVHSAFYIKASCTAIANELLMPHDSEEMMCDLPLLEHEPFNLAEGYYVNQLVYRVLRLGPERLCEGGVDATAARVEAWAGALENVMATHRSNMAQEKLWHKYASGPTAQPSPSPSTLALALALTLALSPRPHPHPRPRPQPSPSTLTQVCWALRGLPLGTCGQPGDADDGQSGDRFSRLDAQHHGLRWRRSRRGVRPRASSGADPGADDSPD